MGRGVGLGTAGDVLTFACKKGKPERSRDAYEQNPFYSILDF